MYNTVNIKGSTYLRVAQLKARGDIQSIGGFVDNAVNEALQSIEPTIDNKEIVIRIYLKGGERC